MTNFRFSFSNLVILLSVVTLAACQEAQVTEPSHSSVAAVSQAAPESSTAPSEAPHAIFSSILSELEQGTDIPVLLPSEVPEVSQETPVYAIVEEVSASEYQVLLGFTPDCNGGTACRLGQISAQTAPLTRPESGESITLNQDIQGYFVPATCGANCSDALIMWEEEGGNYTLGLKAGQKETLIKMANSMMATAR